MLKNKMEITGGLKPLPKDERDFDHEAVFGAIVPEQLPDDYLVGLPTVKNQYDTDHCTGYGVTAASELQEGISLNPTYQFAKTKQIMGDYESWGADLRSACKSAVQYGSLPEVSFKLPEGRKFEDLRNWELLPSEYDDKAYPYRKKSYFSVRGDFDAIRSTLYQHGDAVVTGVLWRRQWTIATKGIVKTKGGTGGYGHCFAFIGWKKIDGVTYLAGHLSNGTGIGDGGRFYFSREALEGELKYGNYVFVDIPPENVKYMLDNGIKSGDNWLIQMCKVWKKWCFTRLIKI